MLLRSNASHHYKSAHKRFLKPSIERFFEIELPKMFGPNLRSTIADKLLEIFHSNNIETKTLKSGQMLWNAVDKNTRPDAYNMRIIPVVLSLVTDNDITNLENGISIMKHRQNVIARITKEAHEQGALLSMRDISLFLSALPSIISNARIDYEKKNNVTLPHTGSLQDMGTCLTHEYQIVYKYVAENKEPKTIANETNHTIKAVDRYLKDYHRVKTLYDDGKDIQYIKSVAGIAKHVSIQYIEMIKQYVKEPNYNN